LRTFLICGFFRIVFHGHEVILAST
jgi:hypothetical protein